MKFSIVDYVTSQTDSQGIIARLLLSRGIDVEAQKLFLHPPSPTLVSIADVGVSQEQFDCAYKRLLSAYVNKESVVIYADYDVDGITSATILWRFLYAIGFSVMPYTPDRKTEGYGFSQKGIQNVREKFSPRLIIAVDHGISEEKHIANLKKDGIDVLVLDHHIQTAVAPKSAHSLIYTQQISAAGISYFFVKESFKRLCKDISMPDAVIKKLKREIDIEYVVLSGIASLTDIMPQKAIARALSYHGLILLKETQLVGLRQLLREAKIDNKQRYFSYDAGFVIGPRLNAVGRVSDALEAVRLLCTNATHSAFKLAKSIEKANRDRQVLFDTQFNYALEQVSDIQSNVCFISSADFDEGIVGLIASKLMEKLYIPVLVGVEDGTDIKGSARSIAGVDITAALKVQKKLLISYGGHKRAAGFSLLKKDAKGFYDGLIKYISSLDPSIFEKMLHVDICMPLSNVTLQLGKAIETLEPFGEQNREPLFMSKEISIVQSKIVGRGGKHVQLLLSDGQSTMPFKAIFFNGAEKMTALHAQKPTLVVYSIGVDRWAEEKSVLKIRHME